MILRIAVWGNNASDALLLLQDVAERVALTVFLVTSFLWLVSSGLRLILKRLKHIGNGPIRTRLYFCRDGVPSLVVILALIVLSLRTKVFKA